MEEQAVSQAMKRWILGATILGMMATTPGAAFAQSEGQADEIGDARIVVHDMDALDLEGGTVKPLGTVVQGRMPAKTRSLIKLRANFVDEIVESANAL